MSDLRHHSHLPAACLAVRETTKASTTYARSPEPGSSVRRASSSPASYVEEERAKGFVRPVRHSYKHLKCGGTTTMGDTLAQTYARQPDFYSGTFCCHCHAHFPVGADGEFVWQGTDQKVGT